MRRLIENRHVIIFTTNLHYIANWFDNPLSGYYPSYS